MTEGRRLLLAICTRIGTREVALRTHVTVAAVKHWRTGLFKPSRRARADLATHLGIDARAWDLPARCLASARKKDSAVR